MKLQASLRSLYELQLPLASLMGAEVDRTLLAARNPRWHYESRIKSIESFCSKVETGRVANPSALDDLLACTLVVPNALDIPSAMALVGETFEVVTQKPPLPGATGKPADSFRFDDLRLYCRRGNDGSRAPEPLDDFIFEVQIKTFLQHAWGIATHDLSYKTADVRWGKDRIVAHLKAAIEHAEVSIIEADALSRSAILQLDHPKTNTIIKILDVLKANWGEDDRPYNLRGLAETLADLLHYAELTPEDLALILEEERERFEGTLPINISPYGVIIQVLVSKRRRSIERALARKKMKILLTPELNLPADFPPTRLKEHVVVVQ